MGLALEVGILSDLNEADPEGSDYHATALDRLNSFLKSCELPPHVEPRQCVVWCGEMIGYSGLHDLRRFAAYLDCGAPMPSPAPSDDPDDERLAGYFASVNGQRGGLLQRLFRRRPRYRRGFDHLIVHSDAEGYYLPLDFAEVLFPPAALEIPGGMVGSAPRLLAELERVAQALAIPDSLTPDSDELLDFADEPSDSGDLWQRYGRESLGCVTLRQACRHAIAQQAVLVFT